MNCPCCSGMTYEDCCQPYLEHLKKPLTAEALMRSRYTAFVKHNAAYLVQSLYPDQRSPNLESELKAYFQQVKWLSLRVKSSIKGKKGDQEGQVHFIAVYQDLSSENLMGQERQILVLEEVSRFVFEDQWYYHSGTFAKDAQARTLKRNEPCWCGSGKKYKQCHLK